MGTTYKGILPVNFSINEKYRVVLFIKQARYAETYRVKGSDGKLYFLKLFNYARLQRFAFDNDNNISEISLLKKLSHPNIVAFNDSGELIYDRKKYAFLVLEFIAGETLAEKMNREKIESFFDIQKIVTDVLSGLQYLHHLPDPVIHNEITPQNIMLDLSDAGERALIIDFGFARPFFQSSNSYSKEGLNLNYVASECFNNIFSPQSDLFSIGAVLYHLLFGCPPWHKPASRSRDEAAFSVEEMINLRLKPLSFPTFPLSNVELDDSTIRVLKKALHLDPESRFQSAEEFSKALNGKIEIEDVDTIRQLRSDKKSEKRIASKKAEGKGFDAIAGMSELKAQMQLDVIDALHKPEHYAKYGITIPNGMLLYGPPGCGKTFFAKHFAEEVGFNFIHVTPGTLKSRYVNATEENIAKMFKEAEKNAPTIIFIEEISGLFPRRDSDAHEMSKNAVDALLAEMDRTGEKGIFVLCATNYPENIDPALLRAGRLDKKYYLSPPDFEARKALFEMYLKPRPIDFGIDYDELSKLTENYVSSDIKDSIVDEASRQALKAGSRITRQILLDTIKKTKPSVSKQELQRYETIRAKMAGENIAQPVERTRIGFKL